MNQNYNMADIIRRHNFDQALKRLEQFSNSTPSVPYIEKFETDGGLFGWGGHYINGHEMNNYVEKVQEHLSKQNSVLISTIKEFREVYNTFNFLDKEYLQGIISAVDAANKASEGARTASNQAKEAVVKAIKNEDDIRKEVEALRKVVEKIKTIREDLNTKISKIEKSVNENSIIFNQEVSKRTYIYSEIQTLKNRLDALSDINQLSDKVDLIWEDLEEYTEQLNIIKEVVKENHKSCVSNIEAIRTATDNRHKDTCRIINQINQKTERQCKESRMAVENIKCESDVRHLEVSQRIDKLSNTIETHHEESLQSLKNLKLKSETRHLEVSQRIDKLGNTVETHSKEYINLINTLEQVILQQKQEYTNQIDTLNQQFITQHAQLQKQTIVAWALGLLGIIGSIVAFVI